MLGLLGIVGIDDIIIGAVVAAVLSAATQYGYYKLVTEPQQEKAKAEQDKQIARQEARAKLISQKQYNQALADMARGTVYAKKELIDARRERQAEIRNHGEPVRS